MSDKIKLVRKNKKVRLYPKSTGACRKVLLDVANEALNVKYSDVVVVARSKEFVHVYSNSGKRTVHMGMLEFAKMHIFEQ